MAWLIFDINEEKLYVIMGKKPEGLKDVTKVNYKVIAHSLDVVRATGRCFSGTYRLIKSNGSIVKDKDRSKSSVTKERFNFKDIGDEKSFIQIKVNSNPVVSTKSEKLRTGSILLTPSSIRILGDVHWKEKLTHLIVESE